MKFLLKVTTACTVLLLYSNVFSQGCSDAGFCTMGTMKPDQLFSKEKAIKLRTIEFNTYRGKTLLTPVVYVATLDASFSIKKKSALQIKVPFQSVTGNLGKTKGFGDFSLAASTLLFTTDKFNINGTVGCKIPSGDGSKGNKPDQDLPMYYQMSLGSLDFVAGGSIISKKWLLATGIQLPVIHFNNNTFRHNEWPKYPSPAYIEDHAEGIKLKRGTDVMLRLERNWRFSNYNFNFGVLNIYRVKKDQVYNETTSEYEKLDGTTGFAVTLLAGAGYEFNVSSGVRLSYGLKIADRDVNPDGLTRKMVIVAAYVYRF